VKRPAARRMTVASLLLANIKDKAKAA